MNLTREQAIAEHRKMWNWIADEIKKNKTVLNIREEKKKYLISTCSDFLPFEFCFLCEYVIEKGYNCEKCPVYIDGEIVDFNNKCLNGLYNEVKICVSWQEQATLARKIANLPERTDI